MDRRFSPPGHLSAQDNRPMRRSEGLRAVFFLFLARYCKTKKTNPAHRASAHTNQVWQGSEMKRPARRIEKRVLQILVLFEAESRPGTFTVGCQLPGWDEN